MSNVKMSQFWKKALLVCTILTTILFSSIMNQDKPCFTSQLPNHFFQNTEIIALEFADELSEFDQILSPGKTICEKQFLDRVAFFVRSINWDFGYIVSYGLLFFLLLLNLSKGEFRLFHKVLFCIILLVCILDVGENIFLLKALHHFKVPVQNIDQLILIMFNFAFFKWAFLFFYCLGILYLATSNMQNLISNSLLVLYSFFILLFILFPFMELPLVGNSVQLIIFASLPVLILSLIQAFRSK